MLPGHMTKNKATRPPFSPDAAQPTCRYTRLSCGRSACRPASSRMASMAKPSVSCVSFIFFRATRRPVTGSRARDTTPYVPSPIVSSISKSVTSRQRVRRGGRAGGPSRGKGGRG